MIKVNGEVFKLSRFSDGTLNIKSNFNLVENKVVITWNYESDSEFMALAFLTKYFQLGNNDVFLFLPYVPNARMDRVEEFGDIFTLQYFADLINSFNFKAVYVVDPHSYVSTAVIKNCFVVSITELFSVVLKSILDAEKIKKHDDFPLIFYPDEGATKKYTSTLIKTDDTVFISQMPYAFGFKSRDWETGKITNYSILGVNEKFIKNRVVIIRDDILSKGTTVYNAARRLKALGASNIYLFVTHMENMTDRYATNLFSSNLITHVFTTDSIYKEKSSDKITVLSINMKLNPENKK